MEAGLQVERILDVLEFDHLVNEADVLVWRQLLDTVVDLDSVGHGRRIDAYELPACRQRTVYPVLAQPAIEIALEEPERLAARSA